jgi:uncharacterized membrane protein YhaH (DUF805 family)
MFQLLNLIVIGFSLVLILAGGGASFEKSGDIGGIFLFGAALFVFWILITFIPSLAVTVRRFHDHNISGWWYAGLAAFSMIPYIGLLANLGLLWVLARGGTWGPNNYGPDPVNPWRGDTTFA